MDERSQIVQIGEPLPTLPQTVTNPKTFSFEKGSGDQIIQKQAPTGRVHKDDILLLEEDSGDKVRPFEKCCEGDIPEMKIDGKPETPDSFDESGQNITPRRWATWGVSQMQEVQNKLHALQNEGGHGEQNRNDSERDSETGSDPGSASSSMENEIADLSHMFASDNESEEELNASQNCTAGHHHTMSPSPEEYDSKLLIPESILSLGQVLMNDDACLEKPRAVVGSGCYLNETELLKLKEKIDIPKLETFKEIPDVLQKSQIATTNENTTVSLDHISIHEDSSIYEDAQEDLVELQPQDNKVKIQPDDTNKDVKLNVSAKADLQSFIDKQMEETDESQVRETMENLLQKIVQFIDEKFQINEDKESLSKATSALEVNKQSITIGNKSDEEKLTEAECKDKQRNSSVMVTDTPAKSTEDYLVDGAFVPKQANTESVSNIKVPSSEILASQMNENQFYESVKIDTIVRKCQYKLDPEAAEYTKTREMINSVVEGILKKTGHIDKIITEVQEPFVVSLSADEDDTQESSPPTDDNESHPACSFTDLSKTYGAEKFQPAKTKVEKHVRFEGNEYFGPEPQKGYWRCNQTSLKSPIPEDRIGFAKRDYSQAYPKRPNTIGMRPQYSPTKREMFMGNQRYFGPKNFQRGSFNKQFIPNEEQVFAKYPNKNNGRFMSSQYQGFNHQPVAEPVTFPSFDTFDPTFYPQQQQQHHQQQQQQQQHKQQQPTITHAQKLQYREKLLKQQRQWRNGNENRNNPHSDNSHMGASQFGNGCSGFEYGSTGYTHTYTPQISSQDDSGSENEEIAVLASESQEGEDSEPTCTALYVGDLNPEVTEAKLFEVFSTVGPLMSIRVCREKTTKTSLGYGYVNFQFATDAQKAIDVLNYETLMGRQMRVMWSQRDPTLRLTGIGNLYVKNLPRSFENKDLHKRFAEYGRILSCKIATDESGNSKGFGFVHFEKEESASNAILTMNAKVINGRKLYVGRFKPRTRRPRQYQQGQFPHPGNQQMQLNICLGEQF